MSGIAGVIYKDKKNVEPGLSQISAAISHRGGSKKHIITDDRIGFTIRCYASSAYETAIYKNADCVVAFDGKIHNQLSFRDHFGIEIAQCPAKLFWTGYKKKGIDFFDQLDGSFSAVIYDRRSNEVILTIDPFGHRPLYYAYDKGDFWFSSEIKGILGDSNYERKINQEQIATSLTYGLTMGPDTLIKDLIKIIPGYTSVGTPGTLLKNRVYFNPENLKPVTGLTSNEDYADKMWETLGENIKQQTNVCKKNGVFLSSGFDSSLVALNLSETIGSGTAVTCGYKNNPYNDESEAAEAIAKESSMSFKNIDTSSSDNILESFKSVIENLENPTRFSIGIPMQRAVSHTNKDIQCLLTGEFADLYFGCEEFPVPPSTYRKIKNMSPLTRQLITSALPVLSRIKPIIDFTNNFEVANTKNLKEHTLNHFRVNKFSLSIFEQPDITKLTPHIDQLLPRVEHLPIETQWTIIAATTLIYGFNELFEGISSASGIDVIFPFQSKSMLEIACAMPYDFKFKDGIAKPAIKTLAKNKFAYNFSNIQKKQFSSPIHDWMNNSPEFHDALLSLESNAALINDYVDNSAVKAMIQDYKKNVFNGHGGWKKVNNLLILLGLEVWLQRFSVRH